MKNNSTWGMVEEMAWEIAKEQAKKIAEQLDVIFQKDEMFDNNQICVDNAIEEEVFRLIFPNGLLDKYQDYRVRLSLHSFGYLIYPSEWDSFGWLRACIVQMKSGKQIYFG